MLGLSPVLQELSDINIRYDDLFGAGEDQYESTESVENPANLPAVDQPHAVKGSYMTSKIEQHASQPGVEYTMMI